MIWRHFEKSEFFLKTEEGSKIKKGKELTASIEESAEAARKMVPSLGDNQREAEMPRRP